MSGESSREAAKRRAGQRAVEEVTDEMVVGLGSGSTAGFAIDALGAACEEGLAIEGVPTSHQAAARARSAGVVLRSLSDVDRVDLAIDGADEVAGRTLLKGGGASQTREKIVATAAERFVVVVDRSKLVEKLSAPVPLEVLPEAERPVRERIDELGGKAIVREASAKSGPVITDNGNFVIDAAFGPIADPAALSRTLGELPGVLEHGLFVQAADELVIGSPDGVRHKRL